MAGQSLAADRVVDPILTAVARGYRPQNAMVAEALFPVVMVGQRAGTIIKFGPDEFKLINTARAPGSNTKRVQFGYGKDRFSLIDHSLEGAVPKERLQEANAVPGIDLAQGAIRTVQGLMSREREWQAAQLAVNPANYDASNKATLSGTDRWDNPASDPAADIDEAREIIRQRTGVKPNKMVVAPKVLTALRRHPKILDRMSTASDRPPATIAQLQAILEIEQIVEADSVYFDEATNLFVDMWQTSVVLAYTTPASLAEMGSPSYGYTYRLTGMPEVEEPYTERNAKTWFYPVTDAYQAVLAGSSAGFLFSSVVS